MVRVLPKWHLNGKLAENDKNVKMAKTQNECGIVLFTQFNSQKSTQNPFYNGASLPKWHVNGKIVENEVNAEGGKI